MVDGGYVKKISPLGEILVYIEMVGSILVVGVVLLVGRFCGWIIFGWEILFDELIIMVEGGGEKLLLLIGWDCNNWFILLWCLI